MAESALRQLVPQSAEPFVRSYNPFNPAFRETIRATASDLLGGRAIGGTPSQRYRAQLADLLTGSVDFMPGVSDAVAVSDTVQAARGGDYGTAAILGGATMLGMVPVIGDSASRAIREGLDMSQAARMQRAGEQAGFTAYHGTPHVFGESQRVRDINTGKEYVSDPKMVSQIMQLNPGKYEVLGENPLGMFDLSKLGTGEGAQAYGVGTYLGGVADTGRDYRTALLRRSGIEDIPVIGNQPITDFYSAIESKASRLPANQARKEYDKLEIVEQLMIDGDILSINQRKEQFTPEAFAWFEKNVAPKFSRPGALYQVQVNAPESRFLDWDVPVSAQDPEVLQALQKGGIYSPDLEYRVALLQNEKELLAADRDPITNMMRNERRWHDISKEIEDIRRKQPSNMTGQQAYYMAAPNATNQAEASQALLQLGIPGIRYLDAVSRSAGEGSRNFVIFDPKMIDITAKYGVMGGAVGLSALNQLVPRNEERRPD